MPLSKNWSDYFEQNKHLIKFIFVLFQLGNLEVTWVVSDYSATPGTNELTVTKGQQVEVVEATCANDQDFCLVRLNPQTDDGAAREGIVPISILKPPPGSQKPNSRKETTETIQEQGNLVCFAIFFILIFNY